MRDKMMTKSRPLSSPSKGLQPSKEQKHPHGLPQLMQKIWFQPFLWRGGWGPRERILREMAWLGVWPPPPTHLLPPELSLRSTQRGCLLDASLPTGAKLASTPSLFQTLLPQRNNSTSCPVLPSSFLGLLWLSWKCSRWFSAANERFRQAT